MGNECYMKRIFQDIEEFYSDNEERRFSGEADYGVWWKSGHEDHSSYRISYVEKTGEIYIVEEGFKNKGFIALLAIVPPDNREGGLYYRTLETILEGWADMCGKPNGIEWVKERLRPYSINDVGVHTVPNDTRRSLELFEDL